jgi:predicted nucleotidyltransferase
VYSLQERYDLLKEVFPQYLVHDPVFGEVLCEVPVEDVKIHYKPVEKLRRLRKSEKLDMLESKALRFAELLKREANVSWSALGVSGSILVGLHGAGSDVDLIVYGADSCNRVCSSLKDMFKRESGLVRPYTVEQLRRLFEFRSKDTAMSFEDFVRTESRKLLQGMFLGTDYFVRFVKDWGEVDEQYGDVRYENLGCARIEADVVDDSEAIFTPCVYKVQNAKSHERRGLGAVEEIVSFRGRFCEQAKKGESVVAEGKVECVQDTRHNRQHLRLLVGNRPSDYLVITR